MGNTMTVYAKRRQKTKTSEGNVAFSENKELIT